MLGDLLAWILGIAAVAVLALSARRRQKMREEYHAALIREFSEDQ